MNEATAAALRVNAGGSDSKHDTVNDINTD
jgi:hypothetical protein